jgi:hypothetical protein
MILDQRFRQASDEVLHAVAGREGAPVTSVDRRDRWQRLVAVAAVVVIVTVGVGSFALQRSGDPESLPVGTRDQTLPTTPSQDQVVPTTAIPGLDTTDPAPTFDGFSVIRRVGATGDLIGIRNWSISRSTDGGETWSIFHGTKGQTIEILNVAPDGTIVAVENRNDIRRRELGPDSVSNDPPKVHMYDPATGDWQVSVLPRPELPIPDLAPAPRDGTGPCDLGGLQSWVDGVAVAIGEEIVIVGGHAVNGVYVVDGEAVCSEGSQFLWTSSDGLDWTIVPNTGTDQSLSGLVWTGDSYLGYGSRSTFLISDTSLSIVSTTNLSAWTPITLDLSVLPDNIIVNPTSATSGNSGSGMAGVLPSPVDTITFTFPALRSMTGLKAALEAGLSDVEELRSLLDEEGDIDITRIEDDLDLLKVDFPLDEAEAMRLLSFYDAAYEQVGRLIVEYTNNGRWTTTYLED